MPGLIIWGHFSFQKLEPKDAPQSQSLYMISARGKSRNGLKVHQTG